MSAQEAISLIKDGDKIGVGAFNGIGSIESTGTRISPQNEGLYGSEYVCQWFSGCATTIAST